MGPMAPGCRSAGGRGRGGGAKLCPQTQFGPILGPPLVDLFWIILEPWWTIRSPGTLRVGYIELED